MMLLEAERRANIQAAPRHWTLSPDGPGHREDLDPVEELTGLL